MTSEYVDFSDSIESEFPHIISINSDYIHRAFRRMEKEKKSQSEKSKFIDICRRTAKKLRGEYTELVVSSLERFLFPGGGYYQDVFQRWNREISIDEADVVIIFAPYREDYKELLYPVANSLSELGLKVTAFFPRNDQVSEDVLQLFDVDEIVFGNELLTYQDIFHAKSDFYYVSEHLDRLYTMFDLREDGIDHFFKQMLLDIIMIKKLSFMISPDTVFGLHFMMNPGYLFGLSGYSNAEIILIQHGIMPPEEGFHDFKGADEVLIWGQRSKEELSKIATKGNLSTPKSKIVGNPKLEQIRKAQWFRERVRENGGVVILYVSSAGAAASFEYAQKSAKLFSQVIENLQIPVTAMYKPHPKNVNNYPDILDINIDKNKIKNDHSVYELIANADIVVGTESTVMVEAVALETPAIQLLPDISKNDLTEHGLIGINTHSELRDELRLITTNTSYRKEILEREKSVAERYFAINSIESPISEITKYLGNKSY